MTTLVYEETEADVYLTFLDLAKRWKVSRAQVYNLVKRPDFPHVVRLGKESPRVRLSDVRRWEQLIEAPVVGE